MSISNTVKKVMPYLKTASGYVLHRLSSQAVEMDDGTTLEQKVTSLNSLISNKVDTSDVVNDCLTTEEGFVLDGRQGKILDDKITELNGNKSNVLLVDTIDNVIITIPSNGVAEGTQDVSREGYKAIGVVGSAPNFTGAIIERLRVYNEVLEYRISRKSSTAANDVRLYPRILYVKS